MGEDPPLSLKSTTGLEVSLAVYDKLFESYILHSVSVGYARNGCQGHWLYTGYMSLAQLLLLNTMLFLSVWRR